MHYRSFISITHKACMYVKYNQLGYIDNYSEGDIVRVKSLIAMFLLSKSLKENQQIVGETENPYTVKCYDYNTNQYFNMTLSQEWIDKIEEDIWEELK